MMILNNNNLFSERSIKLIVQTAFAPKCAKDRFLVQILGVCVIVSFLSSATDSCCGFGGMLVQSIKFIEIHLGKKNLYPRV